MYLNQWWLRTTAFDCFLFGFLPRLPVPGSLGAHIFVPAILGRRKRSGKIWLKVGVLHAPLTIPHTFAPTSLLPGKTAAGNVGLGACGAYAWRGGERRVLLGAGANKQYMLGGNRGHYSWCPREERKEDAIFDPLALTFQATCTPENSAQMSIGIGLGRTIPGWRLRQVEEHPGFLHSHMPYGSHQHSEGLPTRLLQVHRTVRKALGKAMLEMFIIEPPV